MNYVCTDYKTWHAPKARSNGHNRGVHMLRCKPHGPIQLEPLMLPCLVHQISQQN